MRNGLVTSPFACISANKKRIIPYTVEQSINMCTPQRVDLEMVSVLLWKSLVSRTIRIVTVRDC